VGVGELLDFGLDWVDMFVGVEVVDLVTVTQVLVHVAQLM